MSAFAGIDVGSSATKAVVWDGGLRGLGLAHSAADFSAAAAEAYHKACEAAGVAEADVELVCATGYGRDSVPLAQLRRTEIDCHARGAYHSFPREITVVDIGGQDNKIIKLDAAGNRLDFKMNRKCAAGTGAFLEEIARRIGIRIEEMEALARQSTQRVEIGSFCTVFSATEILALVRRGAAVPDIVKGAFRSVVKRVAEMDPLMGNVVATGGVVAHNPTIVALLAEAVGAEVLTPPHPQLTGAYGAALFARDDEVAGSA